MIVMLNDLYDENGNLINLDELPEEARMFLQGMMKNLQQIDERLIRAYGAKGLGIIDVYRCIQVDRREIMDLYGRRQDERPLDDVGLRGRQGFDCELWEKLYEHTG